MWSRLILAGAAAWLCLSSPISAAEQRVATPVTVAMAARPAAALAADDLSTFLDGYMAGSMSREDVAGAVVVVVKDGQVILQKGYGYADVASKMPVDPSTTIFRSGSVSKLFTWTAVMQQVEAGRLDLDSDVNKYLDFRLPAYEGKPITLRNLMTHTGGFAEVLRNVVAENGASKLDLRTYLVDGMPRLNFAPGTVTAYSNYGAVLAGYIVQRVSGERYEEYVQRHILTPLGMTHSTFEQPLPAALRPYMSKGYDLGSGKPHPFEVIPASPAGGNSASGADMARFMLAYLQGGAISGPQGEARILEASTVKAMLETRNALLPSVNSFLLGFYEERLNGHRVLGHGGDTLLFHTELMLFPDDNVGIYVAVNSEGVGGGSRTLLKGVLAGFADRYFPGDPPNGSVDPKVAGRHAAMMKGLYERSDQFSNFLSIMQMPDQAEVTVNADGTISYAGYTDRDTGAVKRWREISPFLWRQVDGNDLLSAKVENGRVIMFAADQSSASNLRLPVPWWKAATWIMPALVASLAALVCTSLLWPVVALVRRRSGAKFSLTGNRAIAYRAVRTAAFVVIATLMAFILTIASTLSDFSLFSARTDWWIWTLHVLALAAFPGGAAVSLWNASTVWLGGAGWFARAWSAILVGAFAVVLWVAVVFQLIAFNVQY